MSVRFCVLFLCLGASSVRGESEIARELYDDFKTAADLPLKLKELRPKRPDEPWKCDVATAVKDSDPAVFQADVVMDSAFGGRQIRASIQGKERKEIDGTYGLSASKHKQGLLGRSSYEVVWRGTSKKTVVVGHKLEDGADPDRHAESYEDATTPYELSYWHPVTQVQTSPVTQVRLGTVCLRKLGEEILIEVAAAYFSETGEAIRNYKNHASLDLTSNEIALRKNGLPSQCFENTRVEWLMLCH